MMTYDEFFKEYEGIEELVFIKDCALDYMDGGGRVSGLVTEGVKDGDETKVIMLAHGYFFELYSSRGFRGQIKVFRGYGQQTLKEAFNKDNMEHAMEYLEPKYIVDTCPCPKIKIADAMREVESILQDIKRGLL